MKVKSTFRLLLLAVSTATSALAGTTFGIYRSTDGGQSWLPAGRGLPPDLRVDAVGDGPGVRLAGTERGLYVSTDDGHSWTRPQRGVPEDLKVYDFVRHGDDVYAATGRGVWVSADAGKSWKRAGSALDQVKVMSMAVAGDRVFAGTDQQGVYVWSGPGKDWEPVGTGLPAQAQVFQFAVRKGILFAALYSQGVFGLDTASNTWKSAGPERPLHLVAVDGVLVSGRNPGGVYTLAENGETWSQASVGLPDYAPTWTMARAGSTVLYGTSGHSGLLRTEDAGQSWVPSDRGLPPGSAAIAFGVADRSILAVVLEGRAPRVPNIFPSVLELPGG